MALTKARYFLAGTDSIALGDIRVSTSNIVNCTFSWWMKLDTGAISEAGLRNLFSKQTGNNDQFAVRKSGTNFSIHLQYGGWNQTWTHALVQDTSWHHYMWAWEAAADHGILYTDGSLTQDTIHADIGYLEAGDSTLGYIGKDPSNAPPTGVALCDIGIWKDTKVLGDAQGLATGAGAASIALNLRYSIPLQGADPEAVDAGLAITGTLTGTTVVSGPFPTATTTVLESSLNPSTDGAQVTFTATVTGGTPTGDVTFLDGVTTLGTGTLSAGVATFATSSLAVGSHSITASFPGGVGIAASVSDPVVQDVQSAGGDVDPGIYTVALTSAEQTHYGTEPNNVASFLGTFTYDHISDTSGRIIVDIENNTDPSISGSIVALGWCTPTAGTPDISSLKISYNNTGLDLIAAAPGAFDCLNAVTGYGNATIGLAIRSAEASSPTRTWNCVGVSPSGPEAGIRAGQKGTIVIDVIGTNLNSLQASSFSDTASSGAAGNWFPVHFRWLNNTSIHTSSLVGEDYIGSA